MIKMAICNSLKLPRGKFIWQPLPASVKIGNGRQM